MYYPSTRLFSVLELLQTHPQLSGKDIATVLEVDVRSVRRYIMMLQELGMPIETTKGRYGGYRLRRDYKLPPIVFQNDEVLALVMGLLFTQRLGLAHITPAANRAIAKLERIMPEGLTQHLHTFNEVIEMETPRAAYELSGDTMITLSQAIHTQKTVWLRYAGRKQEISTRKFDPYALVFMIGLWYVTGYCHLREAYRTFRIDRIMEAKELMGGFEKPAEFNAPAFVEESIARTPNRWLIELMLPMPPDEARQHIPRTTAVFTETPEGTHVQIFREELERIAFHLIQMKCEYEILAPAELKTTLVELAAKAHEIAKIRFRS